MLPPTIYFFVVLHIILIARNLLAEDWGSTAASSAIATIGALVIGKSILIADALPVLSSLRRKRLIYDIAARSILYVVIAWALQFLEEFIPLLVKHDGWAGATKNVISEIDWPQFWMSHLFMIVFVLFYTVATGVMRAFGQDKVCAALLNPVQDPDSSNREVSSES